jgi:putative CocE/NonD family hydrolase
VNVVQGVLRARYRHGYARPTPLEPFAVYELTVELGPVGAVFEAGHRLRLQVSSSDFPLWDRNPNACTDVATAGVCDMRPATQCVLHDDEHPSRLTLPVIGS